MPTAAQVRAAIVSAQQNEFTFAEMASLLKAAIAAAMVDGSGLVTLPWTSVSADGVSQNRMTIAEATALVTKFNSLDSGGIVGQYVEFRDQ